MTQFLEGSYSLEINAVSGFTVSLDESITGIRNTAAFGESGLKSPSSREDCERDSRRTGRQESA